MEVVVEARVPWENTVAGSKVVEAGLKVVKKVLKLQSPKILG